MPPGRTGNVSGTYYGLEMTPEEEALLYGDPNAAPPPPQGGGYATEPQGGNEIAYSVDSPEATGYQYGGDPTLAPSQPYQAAPTLPAPESAAYLPSTTPSSPTMDQRAANSYDPAGVLTDLYGPTPTQNGATYIPASQRNSAGMDNIQQAPELNNRSQSPGDIIGGAANDFITNLLSWGAEGADAQRADLIDDVDLGPPRVGSGSIGRTRPGDSRIASQGGTNLRPSTTNPTTSSTALEAPAASPAGRRVPEYGSSRGVSGPRSRSQIMEGADYQSPTPARRGNYRTTPVGSTQARRPVEQVTNPNRQEPMTSGTTRANTGVPGYTVATSPVYGGNLPSGSTPFPASLPKVLPTTGSTLPAGTTPFGPVPFSSGKVPRPVLGALGLGGGALTVDLLNGDSTGVMNPWINEQSAAGLPGLPPTQRPYGPPPTEPIIDESYQPDWTIEGNFLTRRGPDIPGVNRGLSAVANDRVRPAAAPTLPEPDGSAPATPTPVTTPGDRSANRSTTGGTPATNRMATGGPRGQEGFTDVYGTRGGDPALQELKGVLQADGTLDPNGNISTQGMTDFKTLGWVDSSGRWTAKANTDGAVDGDKIGSVSNALHLRPKGTAKAADVPAFDPANDPNATTPSTNTAAASGGSNREWVDYGNSGGGGRSTWRNYGSGGGGGGGYSSGGYSGGGGGFSGGGDMAAALAFLGDDFMGGRFKDIVATNSVPDWESFLEDVDGDGEFSASEIKAAKRKSKMKGGSRTRRSKTLSTSSSRSASSSNKAANTGIRKDILERVEGMTPKTGTKKKKSDG